MKLCATPGCHNAVYRRKYCEACSLERKRESRRQHDLAQRRGVYKQHGRGSIPVPDVVNTDWVTQERLRTWRNALPEGTLVDGVKI
jgi:hypothetical protein